MAVCTKAKAQLPSSKRNAHLGALQSHWSHTIGRPSALGRECHLTWDHFGVGSSCKTAWSYQRRLFRAEGIETRLTFFCHCGALNLFIYVNKGGKNWKIHTRKNWWRWNQLIFLLLKLQRNGCMWNYTNEKQVQKQTFHITECDNMQWKANHSPGASLFSICRLLILCFPRALLFLQCRKHCCHLQRCSSLSAHIKDLCNFKM